MFNIRPFAAPTSRRRLQWTACLCSKLRSGDGREPPIAPQNGVTLCDGQAPANPPPSSNASAIAAVLAESIATRVSPLPSTVRSRQAWRHRARAITASTIGECGALVSMVHCEQLDGHLPLQAGNNFFSVVGLVPTGQAIPGRSDVSVVYNDRFCLPEFCCQQRNLQPLFPTPVNPAVQHRQQLHVDLSVGI
jgi:hypothetical protein